MSSRRIGRGGAGAILLGAVLATPALRAQIVAPVDRPVVVAAKVDAEGLSLLIVPIKVGTTTFWCNVDSGGSWVFSIDRKKALQAGLQPNATGSIAGVGPEVLEDQRVRGATAEIGSLALRDLTLVMVDIPKVVPDMDCVFGLGLLHNYVVEFDYLTPALRIFNADTFRQSPAAVSLPFELDRFRNPHLTARMRLGKDESVEGDFMVDTGGGYYTVVMTKPFIDANHVQERTGTVVSQVADTPGLVLAAARPAAMTVGPFEIAGPVAALILTPSRGIIEDGLIGTGFLRRFTVTFDYTRKQVWLEPNNRLRDQQPFDASGLEFRRNADNAYAVVAVAPGSAGDNAGVHKGDVLLQVNERDVRDTTLGELKALLSRSGVTCTLKIDRDGTMRTLTVALKNRL
jgi:PDZ domain-containing protein